MSTSLLSSSLVLLSAAELSYQSVGLQTGVRADGRGRLDYRFFTISSDVIDAANASASVTLGATRVLVSVALELVETLNQSNNQQNVQSNKLIHCSCELASHLSSEINDVNALTQSLSNAMDQLYNQSINPAVLTLIPGRAAWNVHIDALIVEAGGNELDAISWAVKTALLQCQLPRVDVITMNQSATQSNEQSKLVFNEDPSLMVNIPVNTVPLCVTINSIDSQSVFVDCTSDEEQSVSDSTRIGVTQEGQIVSWNTLGGRGLTRQEIATRRAIASKIGGELHRVIEQRFEESNK